MLQLLLLPMLLLAAGTAATSDEPAADGLDLLSREELLAELRRVRSVASSGAISHSKFSATAVTYPGVLTAAQNASSGSAPLILNATCSPSSQAASGDGLTMTVSAAAARHPQLYTDTREVVYDMSPRASFAFDGRVKVATVPQCSGNCRQQIQAVKDDGARLVALTEEHVSGTTPWTGFQAIAKEVGIAIVVPMRWSDTTSGDQFNAAVICLANGSLAQAAYTGQTVHEKQFPVFGWPPGPGPRVQTGEMPVVPAQSGVQVYDVPLVGRVGIAMCFDVNFPEMWYQAYALGAQIMVWPTVMGAPDRDIISYARLFRFHVIACGSRRIDYENGPAEASLKNSGMILNTIGETVDDIKVVAVVDRNSRYNQSYGATTGTVDLDAEWVHENGPGALTCGGLQQICMKYPGVFEFIIGGCFDEDKAGASESDNKGGLAGCSFRNQTHTDQRGTGPTNSVMLFASKNQSAMTVKAAFAEFGVVAWRDYIFASRQAINSLRQMNLPVLAWGGRIPCSPRTGLRKQGSFWCPPPPPQPPPPPPPGPPIDPAFKTHTGFYCEHTGCGNMPSCRNQTFAVHANVSVLDCLSACKKIRCPCFDWMTTALSWEQSNCRVMGHGLAVTVTRSGSGIETAYTPSLKLDDGTVTGPETTAAATTSGLVATPKPEPAQPKIAAGSEPGDPSEQLQRDLNAAIAAGSSTFAIAPGVYRPKRDLLLNNARDLKISPGGGGKVILLFTCNWGLVLRSSINVSVSDVTIDYDPPCYSQGVVESSTPSRARWGHSTFTYTLDEGFPAPIGESATSDARFAQAPIVKCIRWSPDTQLKLAPLLKLAYTSGSPTNQGPRHIKHLGGRSYELGIIGNASIYQPGEIVTVSPRAGHTVLLTNSSSCTIEGLTIHGSSDMVLVEYGGGGAHIWRGNRVVRNTTKHPLGLLVSNADIFQSSGCERGPLVESNELTFAGDDCMSELQGPPTLCSRVCRLSNSDSYGVQTFTITSALL